MKCEFRILETCPDLFFVEYRFLGVLRWLGWMLAERQSDNSLEAARERLKRVKKSMEWRPVVHNE
jgi:hypothetical protein